MTMKLIDQTYQILSEKRNCFRFILWVSEMYPQAVSKFFEEDGKWQQTAPAFNQFFNKRYYTDKDTYVLPFHNVNVLREIFNGQKISAIKEFRCITGATLKESKDEVEEFMSRLEKND